MKTLFKKNKSASGQSVVEFALVLPFLLIVLMGIIEFGRLWEMANLLTSAAREGARVAAVTGPDLNQVRTAAQNILNARNVTGATITASGPNGARQVTVTVQITYSPITRSFIPGLGNIQISRSTTMLWEG